MRPRGPHQRRSGRRGRGSDRRPPTMPPARPHRAARPAPATSRPSRGPRPDSETGPRGRKPIRELRSPEAR
eukprot:5187614-Prymnesium_polylepis.1